MTPDTSTSETVASKRRVGSAVRATQPLMRWRTIDTITIAFLGAAFGVAYWAYGLLYNGPLSAINLALPPMTGIYLGFWLLAGVVGGLVVRRPGAALSCELIAAVVSALLGTGFGITVLWSGLVQGIGSELAFALLGYRAFGRLAAMLSGALASVGAWIYENTFFYPDWDLEYRLLHLGIGGLSGLIMAGLGGWALTRALARAGALGAFPPGQEQRERHVV